MMKNQTYRARSIRFTMLVLLMASVSVNCRQWQSIVDHDIIRKSDIDSSRYELIIEADPFFFAGEQGATDIPTIAEPIEDQNKAWTTLGPTMSPTAVPTKSATLSPTEFDVALNGGCRKGLDAYEVHMLDTWGDGWDQTTITITGISDLDPSAADLPTNSMTTTHTNSHGDTVVSISKTIELDLVDSTISNPNTANQVDPLGQIFQGTLQEGRHDFADVCLLPNRCYQLIATGGEFLDEVSWEIRPKSLDPEALALQPILTGGAPIGCTFSLPDENGHHFCPNTCTDAILSNSMTEPPKVMENLQPNEEGASNDVLTETVGRTHTIDSIGTLGGTTRSSTVVTKAMLSNAGGMSESAASVLSNFKFADADENSSN